MPFELLPWQSDFVDKLYGTLRDDLTRFYRRAAIWCAKKQGKSTFCAGISLVHMCADGEASPKIYIIASTIEECDQVYQQAADFVRADSDLSSLLHCAGGNTREITFKSKRPGMIKVLSGDRPQGKMGVNASLVIGEELGHHSPYQRKIWADLGNAGMSNARRQPLILTISTSSFDLNGYGYEQYKHAVRVAADPSVDPTFLPCIWSAPMDADPFDEETWKKYVPSLQVEPDGPGTVSIETYRAKAALARDNPRDLDEFCTFFLAQWRGVAETWIPPHVFQQCKVPDLAEEQYHGAEALVGFDGSIKHDLSAYSILIRDAGKVVMFWRAFLPSHNIQEKSVKDGVDYVAWSQMYPHNLFLTEGNTIDKEFIKQKLIEDSNKWYFREVGFDPACGAEMLFQDLQANHGFNVVNQPQGMVSLSSSTNYFEQLVYAKELQVQDNEMLDWCLANCLIKRRGDLIGIEKAKAANRLDIITSAIIGLKRLIACPQVDAYVIW